MSVAVDHDANAQTDNDDVLRLLRDAASAFARKGGLARSRALRDTKPGFDREVWSQMAEQGWLGLLISEEFGGQGLGFSEMAVVAEELARTVSPEPVTASAVYASVILAGSNNDELKKNLLSRMATGETIIGVAGPDRINDAGSIGVTSKGGALNGATGNIYPVLGADGFIIAALDGSETALYYVDAKATGLSVSTKLRADGTTGGTLTLKDVKVTGADLVAKGEGAVAALRRGSDAAVIMTCAELFGTMNEALDLTLEYMRTRVQFGKAIGSYQALQHRAVDLWLQKELAMGALADAVRVLDDPKSTPDQISMAASRAKSRCGDAAHTLGRETIKLHGAIGFTDEYDVGLFLRRAMALNAWLGNPSEHRRRFSSLLRSVGDVSAKKRDSVPFDPVFLSDEKADVDWNSFSDDEFRAGVFAWFDKNYPKNMRNTGRRGSANEMRPWMKIISKKGWIAPAWPTKWGGMGLSPAKQIIYIEERERVGVMREPDMGLVMFGPMLMRWGTEEQKQKYLPRIVSYEDVWCQGYSEPNAGSDLASLQTSAVLDGDD